MQATATANITHERVEQFYFPQISLVTKDSIEFLIRNYHDLVNMLSNMNLQMNFELHHICSELAQNMLEEGNEGLIRLTPNKVVNIVKYKSEEDYCDKCNKFFRGLELAKSHRDKKWNGSSIGKIGSLVRGRGLSSILRMGWNIRYSEPGNRQLLIEISKP